MDEMAFLASKLVQDAVIRNIEIIGEASNNIQRVSPAFAAQHDSIPWQVMYAMRNRVSHGYDKVDFEMVWKTILATQSLLFKKPTTLATSRLKSPIPHRPARPAARPSPSCCPASTPNEK